MRDENDEFIGGQHMDVAVKEFTANRSRAEAYLPTNMREKIEKIARHLCLVQALRRYWSGPEEVAYEEEIEPWIVMELVTCNLHDVQDRGLSTDTKL